MSDPSSRRDNGQHRSWRAQFVNFFRGPSSSSPQTEPVPETLEPSDRTHLLKLDNEEGPAYGARDSCSQPPIGREGNHQWGPYSMPGTDEQTAIPGDHDGTHFVQGPENMPRLGPTITWPVENHKSLYISYYIPFFNWIPQYRWSFFRGDLIAALTIASIYIPMALSLASNLAHAPALNGLYSFVFHPLIYAILGSSPLLVVGPEAAGSLLTGTIVKSSVNLGHSREDDEAASAMVVGIATAMAGAMILIAGLTRLGFLDNVLSRPFLRGFITAIGFVIFVDQLIPEVGLAELAKDSGVSHGSTVEKLVFLAENIRSCHGLTAAVSFGSFAIIMLFRTIKKALEPRYPQVVYFPDRIIVVILSAILTWKLGWYEKGLEVLGPVQNTANGLFAFRWPFQLKHLKHVRTGMSTSFMIAILGFFESSVAAKGLGEKRDGVQGMSVSANREMVALGVANVVGGCFMALPAFGGYGRSKVNSSTGARSPMSSIFLSIITFVCIMVLLPYLYYLPKAVLSSTISVVAYSLIEECPHDVAFFLRLRGWSELALMLLIFVSTIFYSLELGIALGIGLSILILIRHSTQPRIQILGKLAGTSNQFDNAELHAENVELIEGALIVKIPEPLTFANTGDLKNRLRRLEFYGSNRAHPSLPRLRSPEHNKNIIFDVHGVTSIDGSGTQVLSEIVNDYNYLGVKVFFCRVPNRDVFRRFERSGIVERCGGMSHFVSSVDEALRFAESEVRPLEP
ncbi:hypothetical protein BO70DRAFT_311640 [Aspergillus heteromorphus CBS 117.55]|uniref:STAS domain-containing protein n=1 Tax=Aspergillus heteromorphus CBS 117.55 TaxID=1448321 RepID=A0A317WP23_9EURO|nr:uncharacterized protein BO70DRAFT_311640 [Aspergillus heteromorphus CBS 117.55]PWY86827.1 hypothetical protein BO70DRAFT_311640 [Aspergillus heteromorphus CBS 117.55]